MNDDIPAVMAGVHVFARLHWLGLEPQQLSINGHAQDGLDPTIEIRFRSLADLQEWCYDDRAKIQAGTEQSHRAHLIGYWADYKRPGREMLAIHHCFPHCPDRQDAA